MIFIQAASLMFLVAAAATIFLAMRVEKLSPSAIRQVEDVAIGGFYVTLALLLLGCWKVVW